MWKTWRFTHDGGGQDCLPPASLLPKLEGEPTPPREPHGPSVMHAGVLPRIPACVPGAPCLLPCETALAWALHGALLRPWHVTLHLWHAGEWREPFCNDISHNMRICNARLSKLIPRFHLHRWQVADADF